LSFHSRFILCSKRPRLRAAPLIARSASYGDIVNYNTKAHASFFLKNFLRQFYADGEWSVIATTGLILPMSYAVNNPSDTRSDPEPLPRAVR
jgi:hypothetical protein